MRSAWEAIKSIAFAAGSAGALFLVSLGFPLAVLVSLLFGRRFHPSSRPGKLGLEDGLRRFIRLSWICGLVTAVFLGLGLLLNR